jgi:Arc/MetJ family transcription regulator
MRTTIDLPRELLVEAMAATGAKTKREAVMLALEELNRRARLARLADELGDSETFMSYEELMERRTAETP